MNLKFRLCLALNPINEVPAYSPEPRWRSNTHWPIDYTGYMLSRWFLGSRRFHHNENCWGNCCFLKREFEEILHYLCWLSWLPNFTLTSYYSIQQKNDWGNVQYKELGGKIQEITSKTSLEYMIHVFVWNASFTTKSTLVSTLLFASFS